MAEIKWPASKIRKTFIDFFTKREHIFWPSSSVIPHNDDTLLFANAGMNQFKQIFLGSVFSNKKMAKTLLKRSPPRHRYSALKEL